MYVVQIFQLVFTKCTEMSYYSNNDKRNWCWLQFVIFVGLVLLPSKAFQPTGKDQPSQGGRAGVEDDVCSRTGVNVGTGGSSRCSVDGFDSSTRVKYVTDTKRRKLFQVAVGSSSSLMALSVGLGTGIVPGWIAPSESLAADASVSDIFLRLRSIPTFCLVTEKEGIPFMIFDGQASATGYFFLSYELASQALQDAKDKDKNEGAEELWSNAQIIVVPLAVAMQLSLRKQQREAVNGNSIKFNTYNDIIPFAEGVADAMSLERSRGGNPDKWSQKGRVPVFYLEGLTLANGKEPRYFNQADLLKEWAKQNPDSSTTLTSLRNQIQLAEMVDYVNKGLVKPEGIERLSQISFVPVMESNRIASEMLKKKASNPEAFPNYNLSKVFLVKSAKK